jgi:hypothetical protein
MVIDALEHEDAFQQMLTQKYQYVMEQIKEIDEHLSEFDEPIHIRNSLRNRRSNLVEYAAALLECHIQCIKNKI